MHQRMDWGACWYRRTAL